MELWNTWDSVYKGSQKEWIGGAWFYLSYFSETCITGKLSTSACSSVSCQPDSTKADGAVQHPLLCAEQFNNQV